MNLKKIVFAILISLIFVNSSHCQDYTKYEFNPDGWPLPNVQTAQAKNEVKKNLGNVETLFELFITPEKTVFNRVSTKGAVWAYIVDTDGKKPMEYILIRSNELGNFDLRVPASEKVPVPDWVKN